MPEATREGSLDVAQRSKARLPSLSVQGLVPVDRGDRLPISWQQEELRLRHSSGRTPATYHLPMVIRLRGALDLAALQEAIRLLQVRHEGLRTRFEQVDGIGYQVIDPPPEQMSLAIMDLPASGWQELVITEISRSFVLEQQWPLRCWLGRLADQDHILALTLHHIVADSWSMTILTNELKQCYDAVRAGRRPELEPSQLALQPVDYAAWQRRQGVDQLAAGLQYWQQQLAGLTEQELPTDRPRPAHPTGAAGSITDRIPADIGADLTQLATELRVPLLSVLLAGLLVVLNRYGGQDDLAVGSVFSGRTQPELEPMLGPFANSVVLRTSVAGNPTFTELVHRCSGTVLGAGEHQDIPFGTVVDALNAEPIPGRNPLFLVSLSLVPEPPIGLNPTGWTGLEVEPIDAPNTRIWHDLSLTVARETDGCLAVSVEYAVELFDADRVQRLIRHWQTVLADALGAPDRRLAELTILPPSEHEQLTRGFNDTVMEFAWQKPVPVLLAERWDDDRCAVWCAGQNVSYAELGARAQSLARTLVRHGVGRGSVVGVCAYRSVEMVVGLLGTMLAGAAYLPLDPDLPPARLRYQIENAEAVLVLHQPQTAAVLPDDVCLLSLTPRADEPSSVRPDADAATPEAELREVSLIDPAYVIYTSGSTGRPKGVVLTHAGLVNRLAWMHASYPIDERDTVLQKTPFTFDVSVWEFFWPLLAGARLVMAAPEGHRDFGYLARLMREQQVSVTHFVPSVLTGFLLEPTSGSLPALRYMFCSGEALPAETRDRALGRWPHIQLHNLYGPTEASIDVTAWACSSTDGPTVPIGFPIANMRCYVLDWQGNLCPIGVPGRLFLAGVGLASHYANQPAQTAERFVPCPYGQPGERMYDTGDIARWRADGALEYLGRNDHQVKLRGLRIELGEIEHALTAHPTVQAAAVTVDSPAGEPLLAAYLVPAPGCQPDFIKLRGYLADQLPLHMIPATFTVLSELPLTSNGKLDRAALQSVAAPPAPTGWASATQRRLADIWAQLLNIETSLEPHDNFFNFGGSSLLTVQLLSRIRDTFGVDLPLRQLLMHATLADQAEAIDEMPAAAPATDRQVLVAAGQDGRLPLSWQQEGLWFLYQIDPESVTYHLPLALRLRGELDLPALSEAIRLLLVRHEGLRTRFGQLDGLAYQVIDPAPASFELPVVDLPATGWYDMVTAEVRRPFVLEREWPLRCWLGRLSGNDHVLVLTCHHIVTDGWSTAILTQELGQCYASARVGRSPQLEPLHARPADHAAWQRRSGADRLTAGLHYWRQQLAGLTELELPTDRPRPAHPTGAGAGITGHIPAETGAALVSLAADLQVPLLSVVLAGFLIVLSRYTGQDDLAVGSVFSGRTHTELEPLLGYFANSVVLRTSTAGNPTFAELAERCGDSVLAALEHQDTPFAAIVENLNPPRVPGRNPLFQTSLDLQPAALLSPPDLADLQVEGIPLPVELSRFDLTLEVTPQADQSLALLAEYSTELFDPARIQQLLRHFSRALTQAASNPQQHIDDIAILGPTEQIHTGYTTASELAATTEQSTVTSTELATATERSLADLWSQMLGIQTPLRPHDNFFMLGGSSLLAVQLLSQIRDAFTVDLQLRELFLRPALAELADAIDALADARPAKNPLSGDTALEAVGRDGLLPLSWQQEGLWFLYRMDPESTTYHLPLVLRLRGALDRAALQEALRMLMSRHEGLRTRFVQIRGVGYQLIDPAPTSFVLPVADLPASGWQEPVTAEIRRPFVLERQWPLRCWLGRLTEQDHVLVLTCHHIVTDGWSVAILTQELGQCYSAVLAGLRPELTPDRLSLQPADHAVWQRRHSGDQLAAGLAYWQQQLAELPELELPTDRPRPARPTGAGASLTCHIPAQIGTRLTSLAADLNVPLLSLLLAGFVVVLNQYTGQDDLAVGSIFSGRTRAELGAMFGYFVNSVVLRTSTIGDPSFTELVYRCRDSVIGALEHQDIPFPTVVDALHPERVPGRNPLFQTSLSLFPQALTATHAVRLTGLEVDDVPVEAERSRFDLSLQVSPQADDSLAVSVEYSVELFEADRVLRLLQHWQAALSQALANPEQRLSELNVISLAERQLITTGFTTATGPAKQSKPEYQPAVPSTPLEHRLAEVWADVLGVPTLPHPHDDFFALGGSSLDLSWLTAATNERFGLSLALRDLYLAPTLSAMAQMIEGHLQAKPAGRSDVALPPYLVALRETGGRPPLLLVHAIGGSAVPYLPLVDLLPDDQPVYAFEAPALTGQPSPGRIADLAAEYVAAMRRLQPDGPYRLAGWSVGGVIAQEMAVLLRSLGEEVAMLALIDSVPASDDISAMDQLELLSSFVHDVGELEGISIALQPAVLRELTEAERLAAVLDQLIAQSALRDEDRSELERRFVVFAGIAEAYARHRPRPLDRPIDVLVAAPSDGRAASMWQPVARAGLRVTEVPGSHYTLLRPPSLQVLAAKLTEKLDSPT